MTAVEPEAAELPGLLAQVADACGEGAALILAARFGGRQVKIPMPERIKETHPLAEALGLACARRLATAIGHGTVTVPMGPTATPQRRRAAFRALKKEGRSHSYIAEALGVHWRTVARYEADERGDADDRQGSLF